MLLTQHPNLLSQILDNLLLIFIQPAGKTNQNETNGIRACFPARIHHGEKSTFSMFKSPTPNGLRRAIDF
jgi:hypothetical protein